MARQDVYKNSLCLVYLLFVFIVCNLVEESHIETVVFSDIKFLIEMG